MNIVRVHHINADNEMTIFSLPIFVSHSIDSCGGRILETNEASKQDRA